MTQNNSFDSLTNNLKNRFTVEDNRGDFTLGAYMLMQAEGKMTSEKALVPVAKNESKVNRAVSLFIGYVSDKLAVKELPAKDKVIRAFPVRTLATALCSALLVSVLVVASALMANNSLVVGHVEVIDSAEIVEEIPESIEI